MPGPNTYDDIIRAAMKPQTRAVDPLQSGGPVLPPSVSTIQDQNDALADVSPYRADEPQYHDEVKRALYSLGALLPQQQHKFSTEGMRASNMIEDQRGVPMVLRNTGDDK